VKKRLSSGVRRSPAQPRTKARGSSGPAASSGKDAPEINARYAKGTGLMRKGSSINNMLDGDAENSLLTPEI
jgi:hypothetical protein